MSRLVVVTIPGRLGGKGRHRTVRRGAHLVNITPQKTASDEHMVRQFAALEMRKMKQAVMTGPVGVTVNIIKRTPKSWSKKRTAQARWATGKPDLDNVAKLLLDSVLGIVMGDDAQVAMLSMMRVYNNEMPEHVVATFRELEAM